jgi:hypothetical protein
MTLMPRLQRRHVLLRAAARGLHDLDAALDDRGDVFRIGRRGERRQEGEVHAERLVGHVVAARDFFRQKLRRLLRQAGDDAETAGIGHRGRKLGAADEVHAALDDGMADAEHFGDGCVHVNPPRSLPAKVLWRRS